MRGRRSSKIGSESGKRAYRLSGMAERMYSMFYSYMVSEVCIERGAQKGKPVHS